MLDESSSPFRIATVVASPSRSSEDRWTILPVEDGLVVLVADGAGGMGGGGRAADLALEVISDAVRRHGADLLAAAPWVEWLAHADAVVTSDREAGETTLVAVAIAHDGRVAGASCGDSGALLVGRSGVSEGLVDDLTADQHRKRLGSGRARPTGFERAVAAGTWVVATDGLLSYASADVVARTLAAHPSLDEAANALVRQVRLPSGALRDDVAIVLVERS